MKIKFIKKEWNIPEVDMAEAKRMVMQAIFIVASILLLVMGSGFYDQ